MTTTELYSGYNAEGKSSSRVLRPPGGGSSNIFGAPEPNPQQQVRQEQQKEAQKTQSPNPQGSAQSNPTNDAKQEYNRNKPKGRADAPFAMFAESGKTSKPSQFDKCDDGSQNDADFRCYSVTEYRNAVMRNAETRQRAHGQAAGSFNPITHEESGSNPYQDYNKARPHPQQVMYQQQQQQQEQPTRMVRGQGNYNSGKVQYNPITGEEYPASYGQKGKEEKKVEQETEDKKEEDSADENANDETAEENSNNNAHPTPKPEEAKPASAQIQKVRQPPGGKSSGLW